MKKTILFILSSNFSGSHFLSLLLGSHSKAAHLGEVKNLFKFKNKAKKTSQSDESSRQCYICDNEPECTITKNLYNLKKDNIYPTLFSRHDANITHLIDASKKTSWAKNFSTSLDYNIKYIHLVRDPRALVRKWELHYNTPSGFARQQIKQIRNTPSKALQILFKSHWQTYALKWVNQNREIHSFLTSSNLDYQTISYEELATNPATSIASIMEWLDLEFELTQLNYWKHEHHGTQKQKYNTNNNKSKNFIDLKWQQDISIIDQNKIITDKDILSLISELPFNITKNGLFKKT